MVHRGQDISFQIVPVEPISKAGLQRWLRQICDEIGLTLPYRGGYHSIRRRVAITVKHIIKSDIDTYRFMRWADPRELGILAQYDQTRYKDIDRQVLSVHPMVQVWQEILPYLLDMNKRYKRFYNSANNVYTPSPIVSHRKTMCIGSRVG